MPVLADDDLREEEEAETQGERKAEHEDLLGGEPPAVKWK
jgi:hypothetical protein